MVRQRRAERQNRAPETDAAAPAVESSANADAQDQLAAERVPAEPSLLDAAVRELDGKDAPPAGGDPLPTAAVAGANPSEPSGGEFAAGMVGPAVPPGFDGTLGLTKPSSAFVAPKLEITVEKRSAEDWWDFSHYFVAHVTPTTSVDATHWSVATPPGLYPVGDQTFDLKNGPESFHMFLEVDQAAFGRIVDAEQEHLDDFLQAYKLTLEAGANVVNQMAESDFYADTEAAARQQALDAVNGRLHPRLQVKFPEAAELTWRIVCSDLILGADRDQKGWHTIHTKIKDGGIDLANHRVVQVLDFSSAQIGAHPASTEVTLGG